MVNDFYESLQIMRPCVSSFHAAFVVTVYQEYGFHPDMIIPHGSYLMNCGSPDSESLRKSRDLLLEELQRCEKMGLTRFNFHPGNHPVQLPPR